MIKENLRTRATRAGIAHRPEVIGRGDTDDLLIGQARDLFPPRCGFIIIVIDGDEQFVFRQTIHIGDQCPGVIDRLFLEIIAKRKIPQHFEERG